MIKVKKLLYILYLLPLAMCSGLISCGNNGCEEIRETYCMADLISTTGARIDQMYVYGIGSPVMGVDKDNNPIEKEMVNEANPKNIEFILNPDSTVTDARIEMSITLDGDKYQYQDTLHFVYDPHPFFLDMECGCSMFFTLKEVESTNHFFRRVSIKRNEITNEENINIIIEY